MDYERCGRRGRHHHHCNVTCECNPTNVWANPIQNKTVTSKSLDGIQCDPVVTYETVVEPTVYYTLANVENKHYVKHIVPVVYQQTITNVTEHEYVTEQTLDQVFEETQVGYESNVAGIVSSPCMSGNGTVASANANAGAGCGNIIVQNDCSCKR